MNTKDLRDTLDFLLQQYGGDIEVVLQDEDGAKHEHFFVVEESRGDNHMNMEIVLRAWPY